MRLSGRPARTEAAHRGGAAALVVGRAVGAVQARAVDPGLDEAVQHAGGVGRGAQRGDDLGAALEHGASVARMRVSCRAAAAGDPVASRPMAPGPPRSLRTALDWLGEGRRVVAATLVETLGSAPLDPGAEMLVDDGGRIEGSVTGGCVEGALVEEAHGILAGAPPRVATYGISDEQAVGVGLMCGGTVRVFVHELGDAGAARRDERGDRGRPPVALATLLDGAAAGAKMAVREDGRRQPRPHRAARRQRRARRARLPRRGPLGDPPLQRQGRDDGRRPAGRDPRVRHRRRGWSSSARSTSPPRWPKPATAIGYRVTIVDARAGVRAERAVLRARRGRRVVAGTVPGRRGARRRATPCSSSPTTRSSTSPR